MIHVHPCRSALSVLLLVAAIALPASDAAQPPADAGLPTDGELSIELIGATVREPGHHIPRPPLRIELVRRDGVWDEAVWGYAGTYNPREHEGSLAGPVEIADERLAFAVAMSFASDPWVAGGPASYRVELARDGDAWRGHYRGTFRGSPVEGEAFATFAAPRPVQIPGHVAVQPREHPRLLFRKADLPRIRAWAQTPEGRELCEQILLMSKKPPPGGDYSLGLKGAGRAFLWLMTGEQEHADEARRLINRTLTASTAEGETGGYNTYFQGVALAYDLCYDAWDEPFKESVVSYLYGWSNLFAELRVSIQQGGGGQALAKDLRPTSAGLIDFRVTSALMQLAVMGEPGPFTLPRPQRPPPVHHLAEPAPGALAAGVPVAPLADGVLIERWLHAGPFPVSADQDPLQPIGGVGAARPAEGTAVALGAGARSFAPYPPELVKQAFFTGNKRVLTFPRTGAGLAWVLHAGLELEAPALIRVGLGSAHATLHIGPVTVRDGDYLRLPAGRHPLTIVARHSPGTTAFIAPRLLRVPDDQVASVLNAEEAWAVEDARWQQAFQRYEDSGGLVYTQRNLIILERALRRYLRTAVGRHGWGTPNTQDPQAAGNVMLGCDVFRRVLGHDLAPTMEDNANWLLLNLAARHGDDRRYFATLPGNLTKAMAFVPEAQRPLLRWHRERGGLGVSTSLEAILAIVHHDRWSGPTAPPRDLVPLAYGDPDAAGFALRSGDDLPGRDLLLTVEGCRLPEDHFQAHAMGGSIGLHGFGGTWIGRPESYDDHYPQPELQSTVQMPDAKPLGGGRLLHADLRQDGSGAISLDLARRYTAAGATDVSGVSALRAVACDWSGTCGAPGLVAVLDRVRTTTPRPKTWQLRVGRGPVADATGVTVRGVGGAHDPRPADTSLRVSVVTAPALPTLTGDGQRSPAFYATTTDGDCLVWVVMTLQRGAAPHPEVVVEGSGAEAVVRVGERTVRFDGTGLVIE